MEHRFAFVLAGLLGAAPLGAASYYVAPSGSDSAAGSLAAPWATLAKAAGAAQAGDTVYLRQGVYRQTLTAVRSGASGSPIVFRGYPGESAVLAGSDLVTGAWSQQSGNVWRIDGLPATWSVYVDGVEMVEARWPNVAPGAAMDTGWAVADTGSSSTHLADSALPNLALNGAKVRIIPGAAWVAYSRTVQNYSAGSGLDFDSSVGGNASYWPTAGNQYFLYRSLALLDSAGEWYQDPTSLRLYLWVPGGGDPGAHTVEIAKRKAVASVNAFNYIELRDLFTFSGWISVAGSTGSKVVNVHQRYVHRQNDVDGYNFELTHNELNGGSACEWSGGSIMGSSGDGLYIAGTGHTVQDMVIHDVDQIGTYRGAVRMAGSDHTITQNTFYDSGRFLIFHDQAKRGALTYNHLYNAGLLTKDLGATYCYRCNGGGMQIAYNHIHDVHCQVGAGIYLDNGGSNFRVHHNLVHDVDWFALKLNLPSYDNQVVNNTLFATKYWVNAAGSQYPQEMTGTALVNNLYGGGGTAKLITGTMGPTLITNGSYTAPPAIFNTGAWTLAAGSPAIDKGTVYSPYATVYCGAKPDQGCFESACGTPWSAGSTQTPPAFPYPLSTGPAPSATPSPTRTRTPAPSATASPSSSPTRTPSATGTGTQTASPTRTGTASATRTGTVTRSATASATATPTLTAASSASASATASRTASRTLSATPTPSASATPSATGTLSATATGSLTGSPARTETASATLSATLTRTPPSSASATPSPTATGSASPAATPTSTPSATAADSATLTPSLTPSAFSSPSLSATPTATLSAAVSASSTASLTASRTALPPSATATPSPTPSATPSATASASSSATPSASPSSTRSRTSTPSGTPSSTPSASATPSVSLPSATASASPTPSVTASATQTPSASPTRTATLSVIPPASSSPSPTASASATPALSPTPGVPTGTPLPQAGPLGLRACALMPSPWAGGPLWLKLDSQGGHEALRLRLYSPAYTLVWQGRVERPQGPGWGQLQLDLPPLSAGLYYLSIVAEREGAHSQTRLCRLFVQAPR